MREFLMEYGLFCIWVITAAELVLTCLLFVDFKEKREPVVLCMALLGIGLCYDALVLSIGGMVLPPILPLLSRVRFVLHGMLLPLNLAICGYAVPLYRKPMTAVWVLTGILMAVGAAAGCMRELKIADVIAGVTRCVSVSPRDSWTELVNTALSFGTVLPIALTGVWVLAKQKAPGILLAGLLMFGFSALGPATGNSDLIFLISMFGELLMLLCYVIYEKRHVTD